MNATLLATRTALDASQVHAALLDLFIHERVLVETRSHAVQVYSAAVAHDIPVHLPRAGATIWTVEAVMG